MLNDGNTLANTPTTGSVDPVSVASTTATRPTSTPIATTNSNNSVTVGSTTAPGGSLSAQLTQVTPGTTAGNSQMNIQDYSGQIAHDPQAGFSDEMLLANKTPTYTQSQADSGVVQQQEAMNAGQYSKSTSIVNQTAQVNQVDPRKAATVDTAVTEPKVQQNDMQAAQGGLSQGSQVNIKEIDTEATGQGLNEVGKAMNSAAILDLNDVDSRATLKGQIGLLQEEFKDDNGDPIVPPWASGIARQVSRIAAFKGITGTAATEAMSNALLEASISVAAQDAKFFQTVSLQNLNNQQQSIINKANILANMDMKNLDARTTAAVENAKNFMQMDLANLNNEQQAAVINTQQRSQSILEDAKAINTARLFEAESENEMARFYDTLNTQMSQYNASQLNAMSQFNAGEQNAMKQFNANMENQRDQFYRSMQYNIDVSNAEWRRSIAQEDNQKLFEAMAFDAKNMVDMSQEALNRLWDRSDSLLDYIWKSTENELDRDRAILVAQIGATAQENVASVAANANKPGFLDIVGNIAGALLGKVLGI